MSDDRPSLRVLLELDPGTAAFLGLPRIVPIPESHASEVLGARRPSLAALARGLEEAVGREDPLAADTAVHRFLRRWSRYADLERYLRVGNATFADRVARGLLDEDPGDPPALAALSLLEAQQGAWDEALRLLALLRRRAPEHPPSRLQEALCLAAAGRREESLIALQSLGNSPVQSLARLWSYEVGRRAPDALESRIRESFRTQIAREEESVEWAVLEATFPGNPELLFAKSLDPALAGDDAAREEALRAALIADPDHAGAAAALAGLLRRTGRSREARGMLQEILSRHPDSRECEAALGEVHEALGEPDPARRAHRAALRAPLPEAPSVLLLTAGRGLMRLGDAAWLRSRLEAALPDRAHDPSLHQLLARALESSEGMEAAERRLREGLKLCGPRPALEAALADLLRRAGRRTEAEGLLKALVRRQPGSAWGHRGLGDLVLDHDPVRALEHYGRALEIDPLSPIPGMDYLRGLGALRAGDFEAARRHLERAVAGDPERGRAWCDLGAAYFHLGRTEDALGAGRRAVLLAPRHPGFLHNLSVYHEKRFRTRPWRHPLSLWRAWRLRRRASRHPSTAWKGGLWRPESPPGPSAEESPRGEPPPV